MQCKHVKSPPPKKFRTQTSAGKVIATIFWDSEGLLLTDCLPPEKIITVPYYAELTFKLHDVIKQKRHEKLSLGCLLYTSPSPRDRQKSRMPSSA